MVKVEIFRDTGGAVTGFCVTGHADTAKHGKDIVCAGVSVLAQTALLGVGNYLNRDVDYDVSYGSLRMALKSEPDGLTDAILETMILGLNEIEKIHPESVRILERRR